MYESIAKIPLTYILKPSSCFSCWAHGALTTLHWKIIETVTSLCRNSYALIKPECDRYSLFVDYTEQTHTLLYTLLVSLNYCAVLSDLHRKQVVDVNTLTMGAGSPTLIRSSAVIDERLYRVLLSIITCVDVEIVNKTGGIRKVVVIGSGSVTMRTGKQCKLKRV